MPAFPFTLRQLEVFQTLCETRSFRRASEALGITQAAVSNQLKALEEQLGLTLLARAAGKHPQLTTDGAGFLADLGEFWETAQALAAHRQRDVRDEADEPLMLRVLIGNYLLRDYVRPKLPKFFAENPTVSLDFDVPSLTMTPRAKLDREQFDLGLFHEELDVPLEPNMREIGRVRCGVFGHRKFCEGRNGFLTADEVSTLPFLLPPEGTAYENAVLRLLAQASIKPQNIAGRPQFFDVMSAMFEQGESVGVTIEPILDKSHPDVVRLFPLDDWRLILHRDRRLTDQRVDAAETFLLSAVLGDPDYPARKTFSNRRGD